MVIKTASPGVYIQELDLTRGAVDPISTNIGFLAGPFQRGPVDQIVRIQNEVELRQVFGKPTDDNYEYWWTINNFIEYSGQCYVVRCDDAVGDAIDDGTVDGIAQHDQKMRNSTDAFVFDTASRTFKTIDQKYASSSIYLKNEDEYETEYNNFIPRAGKFVSRNPGKWCNGVGVAVIDKGADYQMRLRSTRTPLSIDTMLIINGGDSDDSFFNVLYGGDSDNATTDPINLELPDAEKAFDMNIVSGSRLVQYAKVSTTSELKYSEVRDLTVYDAGQNIECPADDRFECGPNPNNPTETIISEVPTTGGTGSNLFLDLFVLGGEVVRARVALRGAGAPQGYTENDVVTTVIGVDGVTAKEAKIRIGSIRPVIGTVVRIGDDKDGIIGTIMREENNVITLANAVHSDGTFGMAYKGQNISDPYLEGIVLAQVKEYSVLGYYMFYDGEGERTVNVIWEPQEYTRDQGMEWLWPNKPFDGETVYAGKVAKTVNGVPIQEEGSTPSNPVYTKLEGPATLTPSTGDTIVWNSLKERWVQKYIPKLNDIVYDSYVNPNDDSVVVYPYTVLDAYDWYSQQVAFEGIPWIQFAPRPGTSAHAQEMGCEDDEVNVIVYDALGDYDTYGGEAPQRGRVIEQYLQASKLKGALTVEGSNNFYKDLINRDSQIIFSNLPLNIIDNNTETDPDLNINTLNDGRVYPDTPISYGLRCAFLEPRYGTPNSEDPNSMSTLISTSGVGSVDLLTAGEGFAQTATLVRLDTYKVNPDGKGLGLKVDITTDVNGSVIDVKPSEGFNGTNYQYGDVVAISPTGINSSGNSATFKVETLTSRVKAPYLMLGGVDQLSASLGEVQAAYSKIVTENVADLDYILQGPAYDNTFANEMDLSTVTDDVRRNDPIYRETVYQRRISQAVAKANYLISIADENKGCIACISPPRNASLDPIDSNEITQNVLEWAGRISSSSYGVMDSGYKYMYDRFRDKFMYTPLNSDIAGCMTRTSLVSQPFFSPGGMVRGQIKNVVKLGFDPSKSNRDLLYSARVNPVCTFPGEGVIMYGDKTALGYSSAFTRINVRKLFIYCEKAIGRFAREVLFEFNDVPTRLNFVNTVSPFLTDVVSKRGATDYLVVCDSSNNPPDVIDRNEFVADIYIKPNRSINFVQLTFVATKTGVSFQEAVATNRRNAS